jgi:hypothetical protein
VQFIERMMGAFSIIFFVGGLDWCSFAPVTTEVPEISGKLNGKKTSFHMGHIIFAAEPECRAAGTTIHLLI